MALMVNCPRCLVLVEVVEYGPDHYEVQEHDCPNKKSSGIPFLILKPGEEKEGRRK